jgi:type IV pilus assembly protein PilY1
MGDPLHTRPAVVIYGGTTTTPNIDDAVVYAVTNDGYLHSFDTVTGSENWAFIPWDLLGRLGDLYRDYPSNPRASLGLDGIIRVLRLDRNFDGIIDSSAGDRVYLYMGMRRGGQNYYALDVTDKNNPKLLWQLGPSNLPNVGQTWSTPQISRMVIPGTTQNADDLVLVMGGGYDQLREDSAVPQQYSDVSSAPSMGAAVYVVDAISGRLLWWAGPDIGTFSPAPTIQPAKGGVGAMRHSIPGDVRVIDLTGDGYADLMYAADLGGQIWRFEVDKAAASKANAIRAGLLATLGDSGIAGARRFFAAPDVALIRCQGQKWLNIAIGSGNRELPITDKNFTEDRLYTLRDRAMLSPVDWNTYVVLKDATVDPSTGITDVTPVAGVQAAVPTNATGWQVDLAVLAADAGEKAIVEARTFENTIFFTTFVPKLRTDNTIVCTEAIGYNYLYVLSACDGKPNPLYLAQTGLPVVAGGLAGQLNQKGIAPEIAFLFPSPDNAPGSGNRRPTPIGLCGAEACGRFPGYGPKRTFWLERDAD